MPKKYYLGKLHLLLEFTNAFNSFFENIIENKDILLSNIITSALAMLLIRTVHKNPVLYTGTQSPKLKTGYRYENQF